MFEIRGNICETSPNVCDATQFQICLSPSFFYRRVHFFAVNSNLAFHWKQTKVVSFLSKHTVCILEV